MKTISPYEALQENEYVVATKGRPRHVYGLYPTKDIAKRICNDLNKRYIEGEREMLGRSICYALGALRTLGARYGIDVATTTRIKDWEAR